ncbi:MAG: hypothetical protein WD696_20250 [Bryobacteraceae bacterium]
MEVFWAGQDKQAFTISTVDGHRLAHAAAPNRAREQAAAQQCMGSHQSNRLLAKRKHPADVTPRQLDDAVRAGRIVDAKTIIGFCVWQRYYR